MDNKSIEIFSNITKQKLLKEVRNRAVNYGIFPDKILVVDSEHSDSIVIGGRVFNRKIKDQREQLVKEIKQKGYDQVIEEVTYIWFNRFIALKFMEVNDYLSVKVFTSDDENRTEPGIITHALELDFLDLDSNFVLDLKAENKDEELYKYLILRLCNYLHNIMPFMFEKIEDYTELLFPEKLLHVDSIIKDINTIVPEDDWREVEIIGWLYQDYIAEEKDRLIKAKKQYTISQIPAVTQLFTPHWIVQYVLENSLGRLWMLNRPNSQLLERMKYYIKPEKTETDFLKINSPEEIKVCDPACGSGHMLVYAFDLLYAIYEEEGYDLSEISEKILKLNLFGIEIDKRAGELAAFALAMKARKKDRNLFRKPVQPNICVLQNIDFEEGELNSYMAAAGIELFTNDIRATLLQFNEADNFGSLIRPRTKDVTNILNVLESKNLSGNLSLLSTHQKVIQVLKQANYLIPKYNVVIANPPYMGGKWMNARLKSFLQDHYADAKSDLFSAFILRNTELAVFKGQLGFVTPYVWMFISSYEKLREHLLENCTITSLIQLEYNAFEPACVPVCTFSLENAPKSDYRGGYVRLSDFRGSDIQGPKALEIIHNYNEYLKENQ